MNDDQWYTDEGSPGLGEALIGEQAAAAIAAMGSSADMLQHALIRGYLARRDFSNRHYPKTTPGYMQWSATNRFLRDLHAPLGWMPVDDCGIAKTVSPDGSFAITAMLGNEDTGLRHRIPSTPRPRGGAGVRDVIDNQQGDLFGFVRPLPVKTWLLLYHIEGTSGERPIRAELSLPWALGENNHITLWYRRLILPSIDLNEGSPRQGTPHEPEDTSSHAAPVHRKGA
ncbi:MAG: hypothetical protein WD942_03290 [Dehalococcoidia bacterium]